MIGQLGLTSLLALVAFYAWFASKRARFIRLIVILVCVAGGFFVWQPEIANRLAAAVGIGRGADLIFYVWIIVSLLAIVNLHLTIRGQSDVMTSIVRQIAIQQAQAAPDDNGSA